MRPVNIGIGHDDNFSVAAFCKIEILADTRTKCGYHCANFGVCKNFIESCFFDVENFSAQRKYSLKSSVASLLCAAARRIALNEINFSFLGVFDRAIRKFTGQAGNFESIFSAGKFAGFSCSLTRTRRHNCFFKNLFGDGGIFFKIFAQTFRSNRADERTNFSVAEFGFRLSFKLRLMKFNADDAGQAFANVLAAQRAVGIFQQILPLRKIIRNTSQRNFESRKMCSAFLGVDVVGVAVNIFLVTVGVLHGNFDESIFPPTVKINRRGIEFFLLAVEMFDKGTNTAFKMENVLATFSAFVRKFNRDTAVQKSKLAQSVFERVIIISRHGKNFVVGQKMNFCSGFFGIADYV